MSWSRTLYASVHCFCLHLCHSDWCIKDRLDGAEGQKRNAHVWKFVNVHRSASLTCVGCPPTLDHRHNLGRAGSTRNQCAYHAEPAQLHPADMRVWGHPRIPAWLAVASGPQPMERIHASGIVGRGGQLLGHQGL